MKTFFKWVLYVIFLILPLMLLRFVGFLGNQMRWEIGSPTMPGYNWFRWSHAYLILGSFFCFALYIPTIIAILKKSLKPLLITTALIILLVVGSITLAIIGHNKYYNQQAKNAEKALAENPKDSMALERMAIAYSENGEYTKAIELFNKALEITTEPANVIHDRGSAYAGAQSYELAIADYTKAMEMKPDQNDFVAQCYNDRGVAYFKFRKYQESYSDVIKAMEMGYQVHPGFIAALEGKGFRVSQ
ncbi:MAG: tetratricopeptide repeat protein [Candidatus Omnitrophica bacterium]|nr:tetratricopeptide repeat protein [Candidatus Omnitrophota bacterium]